MKKFHPQSPDPFLKKQSDQEIARFGHLNAIVDEINSGGGGGGTLLATLTAGNDAGALDIVNLNSLSVVTIQERIPAEGLSIRTQGSGAVHIESTITGFPSATFNNDSLNVSIGDADGNVNGTYITVDDSTELIEIESVHLRLNLSTYANNAAAITGGLVANQDYYVLAATNAVTKVV